jgi:hypothetical protein
LAALYGCYAPFCSCIAAKCRDKVRLDLCFAPTDRDWMALSSGSALKSSGYVLLAPFGSAKWVYVAPFSRDLGAK